MASTILSPEHDWDVKSRASENDSYWQGKPATESITLLRHVHNDGYTVLYRRDENGLVTFEIPENNIKFNILAPAGLVSKRGETYVVGDIMLLLTLKREEYTYTVVTKQGFKYINVLERDRIKALLEDTSTAPDVLGAKVHYEAIDKSHPPIVPGTAVKTQPTTIVAEKNSEQVIVEINNRLKTSIEALNSTSNHADAAAYKKRLHEYKNALVSAATLVEKPVTSRSSVLIVHGDGFEKILQKADLSRSSQKTTDAKPRETPSAANLVTQHRKLRVIDEICYKYRKRPIIIVPSGTMSIVAKSNIRQLLQDHQFVDPQEALKTNGPIVSSHPMNALELVHTIANKPIKFRVVENSYTPKFTRSDWVSVVCVILNIKGKRWQFQGYPFESFVDLFLTIKGVLFAYDADTIPSEMGTWDIKVLRISRSHRHHDAAISGEFWQYIDEFLLQPRQKRIHPNKHL